MIPSQGFENQTVLNQLPQDSSAGSVDLMAEDSLGLEANLNQLVQKSSVSFLQESQSQDLHNQDNFKIQPLSILQTPSTIPLIAKKTQSTR